MTAMYSIGLYLPNGTFWLQFLIRKGESCTSKSRAHIEVTFHEKI